MKRLPAAIAAAVWTIAAAHAPAETEFPSAPMGETVEETAVEVRPGIIYTKRVTDDPLRIYVVKLDLTEPRISFRPALGQDTVIGTETVRSMADRHGALLAINGDYWTHGGVPLNLMVMDGEIAVAPKSRTAFGITWDGTPVIGQWTDEWSWQAKVEAPNGERLWIRLLNSDVNEDWLTLYSWRYGRPSRGDEVSPVTEAVLNMEHRVLDIRTDEPGVEIPPGGYVLTGRDSAGEWLRENLTVGDHVRLDLRSTRPWQELRHAIGAGPRILKDGEYFQDPIAPHPEGEEFTIPWKEGHYLNRYPRSGLGVSRDGTKVILATVDGRQADWSVGLYQREMAELLAEFGAWDGMDLDSGGSATLVIEGETVNRPSDHANPDGTGGVERSVANALLVFYEEE